MKDIDLAPLKPFISDRHMAGLEQAVTALHSGIEVRAVRNTDFVSAKYLINRVVEEAAEGFLRTAPKDADGRSVWWMGAYACDALVHGSHTLPTILKRVKKEAHLVEYARFVETVLIPLRDLVEAAKPLIVKWVPGQKTEKQLAAEAARAGKEMTCQCCGRGIFAETGKIAHHGYERPGTGWQTASCPGARELPFEVSREALGRMIKGLKAHLRTLRQNRGSVQNEERPLSFSYTTGPWNARVDRWVEVSRGDFAEVWAAYYREMGQRSVRSFDDLKARELADFDGHIRMTQSAVKQAQARYDGWKQTHRWEGGEWVAV